MNDFGFRVAIMKCEFKLMLKCHELNKIFDENRKIIPFIYECLKLIVRFFLKDKLLNRKVLSIVIESFFFLGVE